MNLSIINDQSIVGHWNWFIGIWNILGQLFIIMFYFTRIHLGCLNERLVPIGHIYSFFFVFLFFFKWKAQSWDEGQESAGDSTVQRWHNTGTSTGSVQTHLDISLNKAFLLA